MKKYTPLDGLRWSRNSDSALNNMPQTDVLGRAGGREFRKFHVKIDKVKSQNALVSTASGAIDDWSVPGKYYMTKGGAIQYFMPIH